MQLEMHSKILQQVRSSRSADGPQRVLIVEDDAELRGLLAATFEREGYEVTEAENLSQARLELLFAEYGGHHWLPTVIVTDLRMPDGDGFELVQELRARHQATPVVIVSSFADDAVERRAAQLGHCAVLSKPIALSYVRLAVREACER